MSESTPNFGSAVIAARDCLEEGRQKLRRHHDAGAPGIQLCAQFTDVLDGVILDLLQAAVADDPTIVSDIAIVPNGGYGRRDVAPFSDVDLMLLHTPESTSRVEPFARSFSQSIYDTGLELGFSVRTPAQACGWAIKDATVFTSLAESRFLGGSVQLFSKFMKRFRRLAQRRCHSLIHTIEAARREERRQYGETVYLLRPNLKRSRGALRDLQLVRWVGFARYGCPELHKLRLIGALSAEDEQVMRRTRELLLRLRNDLHFQAGRPQDVLNRDEQVRLAELYSYEPQEGLHPVELFMRGYFEMTSQTRYAVRHFVNSAKRRFTLTGLLGPLVSHAVERDFRVGPNQIQATAAGLEKLKGNLYEILRLMDLANLYDKRIAHETWVAIRADMASGEQGELTEEAIQRFLSIIAQPGRLGDVLRRLHELRVLEKIIPSMSHARCLLQFNDYHKYTVDEHSIRAVEAATEFLHAPGAIGEAYRSIENKRTLHLALLIHDLGKGYPEDHSDVGAELALETAKHLHLTATETESLQLLVQKHLLMAHLGLRHDLNDEAIVLQLAVAVGSPNVLQMLYVLTCADLAAVGPGVLNDWKMDLITQLYHRTWRHLTGKSPPGVASVHIEQRRRDLAPLIPADGDQNWWERQIEALPASLLSSDSADDIMQQVARLQDLKGDQAYARGRFSSERQAVEYTLFARDEVLRFYRIVGVFTSSGNEILSAEIEPLANGVAMDRFYVLDRDYRDEPPQERLEEIARKLEATTNSDGDDKPSFRRIWDSDASVPASVLHPMPTRVTFDSQTSKQYTIVSVFAYDKPALLFAIARTLFEEELSVHLAKIGTYIDQVVDVFYVTDWNGQRVEDESRLERVRQRLLAAIERPTPAL